MNSNNSNICASDNGDKSKTGSDFLNNSKAKINLTKKDIIFTAAFFLSAFIIVDFVIFHGFNLGFTASFAVLFLVLTAYFYEKKHAASVFSYICAVLSIVGAVSFSVYKDYLINAFMFFLVVALFTIYICGISSSFKYRQGSFKILFDLFKSVFVSPLACSRDICGAYNRALSKNKTAKNIIIGAALSLPVLFAVIPLLVSSDIAFEGLVTQVLKNIGVYLIEIVLAVIITPFLIFYCVSKKYGEKIKEPSVKRRERRLVNTQVTVSFLSVISVTYLVYLFSQLAYFFSAFSGILPEGYSNTASVYARRGFYEMFVICVINMVIISLSNMLTQRVKGKVPVSVKSISTFILAFTVLILITAMQKMKLNVEIYGLSKNRLLVFVFMLMIMLVIFFYIVHIFCPKISYMQPIIVVCSAAFIALSFSNIGNIVAHYNISRYEQGSLDSIDVDYINGLSDSTADSIIELTDCEDHIIAFKAKAILQNRIKNDYNEYFNTIKPDDYSSDLIYNRGDFRSYNYSVDRACKSLERYYNSLSFNERKELNKIYTLYYNAYYNESEDTYEYYNDSGYYVYSYNDKSGKYEISASNIYQA